MGRSNAFIMNKTTEKVEACLACGSRRFRPAFTSTAQMHPSKEAFLFSRCEDCGLIFLSTRARPEALGQYYTEHYLPYRGDRAWGRYAGFVRQGQQRLDRARVRAVERYATLSSQSKVLDVGCGKPSFLKSLHEKHACECWGIDFSVEGWRGEAGFDPLHLLEGGPHDIPLEQQFDVITMWHYLEHDYDPAGTLSRLRACARPGAILLVEVPNFNAWSRRVFCRHWGGFHTPRHTAIYTPQTLSILLERSGWKMVKSGLPGTLGPHILWWLSWRERRGANWGASMARYFPEFLAGSILLAPVMALRRWSLDTQLVVAVVSRPVGR